MVMKCKGGLNIENLGRRSGHYVWSKTSLMSNEMIEV